MTALHVLKVGERTLGSRWRGPVEIRARVRDLEGSKMRDWILACVITRFPPGVPQDVTIVLEGL